MHRPFHLRPGRRAAPLATLALLTLAGAAPAAEFTLGAVTTGADPKPFLFITGPIERGDWSRFMRVVRAHPELRGVALESDGGALDDGLAIAKQIAERGFTTALVDTCHSVCAIMFLAGDERYVPPRFTLSVHAAYRQLGGFVARDPAGNETVAWFLGALGYPLALVRLWSDTAPETAARITWTLNDDWQLGLRPMDPIVAVTAARLPR